MDGGNSQLNIGGFKIDEERIPSHNIGGFKMIKVFVLEVGQVNLLECIYN